MKQKQKPSFLTKNVRTMSKKKVFLGHPDECKKKKFSKREVMIVFHLQKINMFKKEVKIYITGASGLVGKNICENNDISQCTLLTPQHKELDLINYNDVFEFIKFIILINFKNSLPKFYKIYN